MKKKDDDWVFLCKQLEPVLAQMRIHFQESLKVDPKTDRNQASGGVVAEAMDAIMSAMRSSKAKKMIQRFGARLQVLLRRQVEDVFALLDQED